MSRIPSVVVSLDTAASLDEARNVVGIAMPGSSTRRQPTISEGMTTHRGPLHDADLDQAPEAAAQDTAITSATETQTPSILSPVLPSKLATNRPISHPYSNSYFSDGLPRNLPEGSANKLFSAPPSSPLNPGLRDQEQERIQRTPIEHLKSRKDSIPSKASGRSRIKLDKMLGSSSGGTLASLYRFRSQQSMVLPSTSS
jgi:hypothetical protein